jgi:hypothetical protein
MPEPTVGSNSTLPESPDKAKTIRSAVARAERISALKRSRWLTRGERCMTIFNPVASALAF